jgi:hypothetical protein
MSVTSRYFDFGGDPDDADEADALTAQGVRAGEAAFTPPEKSSLVTVEIAGDRLPTRIRLDPRWKSLFTPAQYGQSVMDAYRYAVYELALHLIETGERPRTEVPRVRDAAAILLQKRTYDEYQETWNNLFGSHRYTVHGRGFNQHDEPGLTVTATPSTLVSIAIDPEWAQSVDEDTIAADIVDCCNQVRARKPVLVHDAYLDRESDRELTARLVRYEQQLLRNEH